jgi:hypothetical protein
MRRNHEATHALIAHPFECCVCGSQVRGAVVDSRQQVTVKVDHLMFTRLTLAFRDTRSI